jgi:Sugar-transfer associated ATP-grasp
LWLRCGSHVRVQFGLPWMRQLRALLTAAWCHGIFPTEYYHQQVFRTPARRDPTLYLAEREMAALLRLANRRGRMDRLNDLRSFLMECRGAGLPVPRTLAWFNHGKMESGSGLPSPTLPEKDLYLRPVAWFPGAVAQRWRWNAQARRWGRLDETLDASAFVQRCGEVARTRPWLLQESLNNHPDIARFASGGLCHVRIATGLDEENRPQPLFACLHLPSTDEPAWGQPSGELTAAIDVQEGLLSTALGEFLSDGDFSLHPGTGAIIEATQVPQWWELRELVLAAHRQFIDLPFVGWTVALAGAGPVLLEANTNWGVFRQVLPATTPFATWFLHHMGIRADS